MDTESSSDDEKKMMNKRIVVAVDESEESMYALSWCLHNLIQFSHQNKYENENINLVLLYVKPPPPVYSSLDAPGYFLGGNEIATMEKYSKDLATSVMCKAEMICRDFDIKVEKKIGTGEAKDVICLAVDKLRADMLVMGSHDYGFFKR
ncbi:OLC1v1004412C1 [Oldenlandia corymbosa var. corymbosa]|nr:OLC1v1004412C1 [Oldenlandia corymbosa var. corymbosa]